MTVIRNMHFIGIKTKQRRNINVSQTNEDEIEVQTETLSLKATPLENGVVKSKTGDDTSDATYQNWYKAVYMPTTESEIKVAAASTSTSGK